MSSHNIALKPVTLDPLRLARRTKNRVPLACALFLACLTSTSRAAALSVTQHNFATTTLEPTSTLTLVFSENTEALTGRIAVFIGATDVTAAVQLSGTAATYGPSPLGLPLGSHDVVVMFYDGTAWIALARLPLVVGSPETAGLTSASAATQRSFKPKIDLTSALGYTRTATVGKENTSNKTHTGGLQGSVADEWSGDDHGGWTLRAQANAAGSSVRSQALRFAQRASAAEKVDLASYLIEGTLGAAKFGLGHINAGSHPLLMSGLSFRGTTFSYPVSPHLDVTLNAHNGSAVVGADRLLGLYDDTHHFAGATLGFEAYPESKGRLRVEAAVLDAAVARTQPGISTSGATATQESAGIGLRVLGTTEDSRGRFDAAYASSQYRSIGDGFSPTTSATRNNAYLFDSSFQVVRDLSFSERWPITSTVTFKHEYADPLYKSLGAGWAADYQQTSLGVVTSVGPLNIQLATSARNDNVRRVATALVNKVENSQFTLSGHVAQLFNLTPSPEIPAINLTLTRSHQWGTHAPTTLDATLIPNIATHAVTGGLNWSGAAWTFALTGGQNKQDNRQLGSANKDIATTTFGAQLGWRASDAAMLTIGITPNISRQSDTGMRRTTWNPNASVSWQLPFDIALTSSANFDRSYDSLATSGTRNWGFANQLTKTFKLPVIWGSGSQAIQLSLRQFVTYANNRTLQGLVDTQSSTRSAGVTLNISIALF